MEHENFSQLDWDFKVGDQGLQKEYGVLCKSASHDESNPWTITSVHTNVTIRVQYRTKSE